MPKRRVSDAATLSSLTGTEPNRLTESGIIAYVLQEEPQTKTLPVKLLRNGEQVEVELSLE